MNLLKPKRKMKLYPRGKLTDTEIRMEEKKIQLQNKWKNDLIEEKIICKKGRCRERKIINIDGNLEVHEQCIRCNEWKALYEFMLRSNYMEVKSSKESINNDIKNPCRECSKITRNEKMVDNPEQYMIRLLYNYPKLSKEWFQQQIDKNKGLFSSISGLPIYLSSCGSWQVSIQNNCRELEHLPENCEIIALEENIPQHNAIPDLKLAYSELYTNMLNDIICPSSIEDQEKHSKMWENTYKLTPKQSGVLSKSRDNSGKITREYDKEMQQKHLKSMFTCDTKASYNRDKNSKRLICENDRIRQSDMFNIGKKQKWRCFISGVKLSINRNSWNYPSLERLDNTLNHTIENTVLICRLLNTSNIAQWSTEKLKYALKNQKLIEIPIEIKYNL
jgi:hypothetical protein